MSLEIFKNTLFYLFVGLLMVACENTDEPQEDPILYPIKYTLDGYRYEEPNFYLLEEEAFTSITTISASMQNFLQEFVVGEEFPIVDTLFNIREVTLNSDTECTVVIRSIDDDGEEITVENVTYEIVNGELLLTSEDQSQIIPFVLNTEENQLEYCEKVFVHSTVTFTGLPDYSGADFLPCFELGGDPLISYRDDLGFVELGDTLAVYDLTRIFTKQ